MKRGYKYGDGKMIRIRVELIGRKINNFQKKKYKNAGMSKVIA